MGNYCFCIVIIFFIVLLLLMYYRVVDIDCCVVLLKVPHFSKYELDQDEEEGEGQENVKEVVKKAKTVQVRQSQ